MAFRTGLLEGLAAMLADAGVATWRPSGNYATAETATTIGTVPSTPDRVVTLTGYDVSNDPTLSTDVQGVQIRTRWGGQDPRPVDDLSDAIFDVLHNAGPLTLGTGVRVVQIHRQTSATLGQDINGRWSRADSYYATVHRPTPNRT